MWLIIGIVEPLIQRLSEYIMFAINLNVFCQSFQLCVLGQLCLAGRILDLLLYKDLLPYVTRTSRYLLSARGMFETVVTYR